MRELHCRRCRWAELVLGLALGVMLGYASSWQWLGLSNISWQLRPAYGDFSLASDMHYPNLPKDWYDYHKFIKAYQPAAGSSVSGSYAVSLPATLEEVRLHNEATRQSVPNWIQRSDWILATDGGRSRYHYGLPAHAFARINHPTGGVPTQHDVISYVACLLAIDGIRYLEIGVSVGKGLFTQLNIFGPKAEVVALDIEAINPTLARMLAPDDENDGLRNAWGEAKEYSVRQFRLPKKDGTHGTRLTYVNGDEFAEKTWKELAGMTATGNPHGLGGKFNIILSDAMHTRDALVKELDSLLKYELIDLDNPFAIFWDDCNGDLAKTFWNKLVPTFKAYAHQREVPGTDAHAMRINVHGWLGVNEHKHGTCILTRMVENSSFDEALALDASFRAGIERLPYGST